MPAYLTVNELPEIITQPVDATVCEYAIADFTVDAGVTTGATYRWQRSTDSGGTLEQPERERHLLRRVNDEPQGQRYGENHERRQFRVIVSGIMFASGYFECS